MRILVLAGNYPYPPVDGHRLRNYHLLRNLSAGYCFELVTFDGFLGSDHRENLIKRLGPQCQGVHLLPSDTLSRLNLHPWQKVVNLFRPYEFAMGGDFSSELAQRVCPLLASGKYDLVLCCGLYAFLSIQKCIGTMPCLVDVVDSVSLWHKSYLEREHHLGKWIARYVNYVWSRRYERIHCSKAKNMIFVSPVDRDYVRNTCPKSRIWVVPNGVDTKYFKCTGNGSMFKNSLLFTGVMDYPPNHDSILYFVNDILPLVRQKVPDVSLTIVGRNPSQSLIAIARRCPWIKVTGFVEDLRPYFDKAGVYVAPMISGSGLKNKVLEAWSMSKPVVGTSMSCNGLDAKDGCNVLIADTPQQIAGKILLLLSNPDLRQSLASNARKTVEEHYSWRSRTVQLESIMTEVLQVSS